MSCPRDLVRDEEVIGMSRRTGSTKGKMKEVKFRLDADLLMEIDHRQKASRHRTRAAYLTAIAQSGTELALDQIAQGIGELGHLSNGLLNSLRAEHGDGIAAQVECAVEEIGRVCHQITLALRGQD